MTYSRGAEGAETTEPSADRRKIEAWFRGRLPEGWTAAEVVVDRDEITVVLDLPAGAAGAAGAVADDTSAGQPTGDTTVTAGDQVAADDPSVADAVAAEESAGRISRFREETRPARVAVAREAERRFGRKVAWGVRDGERRELFTSVAVPVMTRLRQPERVVLDTLVEAGVARSRAHALAWCVRLVGEHSAEWLGELRQAMTEVERVRDAGPGRAA